MPFVKTNACTSACGVQKQTRLRFSNSQSNLDIISWVYHEGPKNFKKCIFFKKTLVQALVSLENRQNTKNLLPRSCVLRFRHANLHNFSNLAKYQKKSPFWGKIALLQRLIVATKRLQRVKNRQTIHIQKVDN